MNSMEKTYKSPEKAKEVFYASKNAGKISGVDASNDYYYEVADLERKGFELVSTGNNGWTEIYEHPDGRKARVEYGPSVNSQPKIRISKDASRGHLAVGAKDAMPMNLACDSLPRTAQVIDRIGSFVLLEGMALDSGLYFTQGPGGPRKFFVKQEALDYIEYANDAAPAPDMFEGMDIEKASISYVRPEPMTAAQKAAPRPSQKSMGRPSVPVMGRTPPMKRGLLGTPAPDNKLRRRRLPGRDALGRDEPELFPGSSQPDPERAKIWSGINARGALQKARGIRRGEPDLERKEHDEWAGVHTGDETDWLKKGQDDIGNEKARLARLEQELKEEPFNFNLIQTIIQLKKQIGEHGGGKDAFGAKKPDRQQELNDVNSILDDPDIAPERKAQASKIMQKKPGKDADPEPGIHMTDWLKTANQSPQEKEARLAKQRAATARNVPEPQIHMKDWLKASGKYDGEDGGPGSGPQPGGAFKRTAPGKKKSSPRRMMQGQLDRIASQEKAARAKTLESIKNGTYKAPASTFDPGNMGESRHAGFYKK